ncbi:hypothetical protein EVAR_8688_1 [Eumeta japonica]|uniref:Uncharacterized protein n=1 Tax=Eumeta variegata TaxID=151549 RepID=A0A4C1TUN0_EUMVA|nr:hypothetical protein EVAR_8688_1 [Eumeta japonica]
MVSYPSSVCAVRCSCLEITSTDADRLQVSMASYPLSVCRPLFMSRDHEHDTDRLRVGVISIVQCAVRCSCLEITSTDVDRLQVSMASYPSSVCAVRCSCLEITSTDAADYKYE